MFEEQVVKEWRRYFVCIFNPQSLNLLQHLMPLYAQRQVGPRGELGLWKIEEPGTYFEERLGLSPEEQAYVDQLKGQRRTEWLAARYLLHELSGREIRGKCFKDKNGKPYLEGSDFQISISHSHGMAAVLAAPGNVGVDIQLKVDKIERIAHKFMRPEETASLHPTSRIEHLHIYWGAKESLYKAYGRRELDFRTHLHIEPFPFDPTGGFFQGTIRKGTYQATYLLRYEQFDDYVLVYGVEEFEFGVGV